MPRNVSFKELFPEGLEPMVGQAEAPMEVSFADLGLDLGEPLADEPTQEPLAPVTQQTVSEHDAAQGMITKSPDGSVTREFDEGTYSHDKQGWFSKSGKRLPDIVHGESQVIQPSEEELSSLTKVKQNISQFVSQTGDDLNPFKKSEGQSTIAKVVDYLPVTIASKLARNLTAAGISAPFKSAQSAADLASHRSSVEAEFKKYGSEEYNKARHINIDGQPVLMRNGDASIQADGPQGKGWYHREPDGTLTKAKAVLRPEDTLEYKATKDRGLKRSAENRKKEIRDSLVNSDGLLPGKYAFERAGSSFAQKGYEFLAGIAPKESWRDWSADQAAELGAPYAMIDKEDADELRKEGRNATAWFVENVQDTGAGLGFNSVLMLTSAGLGSTVAGGLSAVPKLAPMARLGGTLASAAPESAMEAVGLGREITNDLMEKGYSKTAAKAKAKDAVSKAFVSNMVMLSAGNWRGFGVSGDVVKGSIQKAISKGQQVKKTVGKIAESTLEKFPVLKKTKAPIGFIRETGEEILEEGGQYAIGEAAVEDGNNTDFALNAASHFFSKESLIEMGKAAPSMILMGAAKRIATSTFDKIDKRPVETALPKEETDGLMDRLGDIDQEISKAKKKKDEVKKSVNDRSIQEGKDVREVELTDSEATEIEQADVNQAIAIHKAEKEARELAKDDVEIDAKNETIESIRQISDSQLGKNPIVAKLKRGALKSAAASLREGGSLHDSGKQIAAALNPIMLVDSGVSLTESMFKSSFFFASALESGAISQEEHTEVLGELGQIKATAENALGVHIQEIDNINSLDIPIVEKEKLAKASVAKVQDELSSISGELESRMDEISESVQGRIEESETIEEPLIKKEAAPVAEQEITPVVEQEVAPVVKQEMPSGGEHTAQELLTELGSKAEEIIETKMTKQEVEKLAPKPSGSVDSDRRSRIKAQVKEIERRLSEFEDEREAMYLDGHESRDIERLESNLRYMIRDFSERELSEVLQPDSRALPGTLTHKNYLKEIIDAKDELYKLDVKEGGVNPSKKRKDWEILPGTEAVQVKPAPKPAPKPALTKEEVKPETPKKDTPKPVDQAEKANMQFKLDHGYTARPLTRKNIPHQTLEAAKKSYKQRGYWVDYSNKSVPISKIEGYAAKVNKDAVAKSLAEIKSKKSIPVLMLEKDIDGGYVVMHGAEWIEAAGQEGLLSVPAIVVEKKTIQPSPVVISRYKFEASGKSDISETMKASAGITNGKGSTVEEVDNQLREFFGDNVIDGLISKDLLNIASKKRVNEIYGNLGDIKGFIINKSKAWIIADQVQSAQDAIEIVLHEIGIHYGLKSMVGAEGWEDLKAKIERAVVAEDGAIRDYWVQTHKIYKRRAKWVQSEIDSLTKKGKIKEAGRLEKQNREILFLTDTQVDDIDVLSKSEIFMEEVIARTMDSVHSKNLKDSSASGLFRKLIVSLRNFIRRFVGKGDLLTVDQLVYLALKSTVTAASQEAKPDLNRAAKDAAGKFAGAVAAPISIGSEVSRSAVENIANEAGEDAARESNESGILQERIFPPRLTEALFGGSAIYNALDTTDYLIALERKHGKLNTVDSLSRAVSSYGISKEQSRAIAKKALAFKPFRTPAQLSLDEVLSASIADDVKLGLEAENISKEISRMAKRATAIRQQKGFSWVSRTFASRAYHQILSERFNNLSRSIDKYVSAIRKTKVALESDAEVIARATNDSKNNSRLGLLMTFSTMLNDGLGKHLTPKQIKQLFPFASDALIEAYNASARIARKGKELTLMMLQNNHDAFIKKLRGMANADQVEVDGVAAELHRVYAEAKLNLESKEFYFPLKRFGQYLYRVTDEKGKTVGMFATQSDGEAGQKELTEQLTVYAAFNKEIRGVLGSGRYNTKATKVQDYDKLTQENPLAIDMNLADYFGAAKKAHGKSFEDSFEELQSGIMNAKFDSYLKQTEKFRANIAGGSLDARKTLTSYINNLSSGVAASLYGEEMNHEVSAFGPTATGEAFNENNFIAAKEMVDAARNPAVNSFSSQILKGGFLVHIAGRPAFFVLQLLQQAVTTSWIANFYGPVKAAKATARAELISAKVIRSLSKYEELNKLDSDDIVKLLDRDLDQKMFGGREIKRVALQAIGHAIDSGAIEIHETFGINEKIGAKGVGDKVFDMLALPAFVGEKLNRLVAITSWAILGAKHGVVAFNDETGYTKSKPTERLSNSELDTVINGSLIVNSMNNYVRKRGEQPKYLRQRGWLGEYLSLAMNYKNFGFQMLFQFHSLGLLKAKKSKDKGLVERTLQYAAPHLVNLAVTSLLAGPSAYVLFALLEDLLPEEWLFKIYDKIHQKTLEVMQAIMGDMGYSGEERDRKAKSATFALTNGMPNFAGMDFSNSLRQDLLGGNGDKWQRLGEAALGVTGSTVFKAVTALSDKESALKGARTSSPSFIKSAVEGVRGETRVGKNKIALRGKERLLRALNIQPSRISEMRAESGAGYEFWSGIYNEKVTSLKNKLYRAYDQKTGEMDDDMFEEIVEEVDKFNEAWREELQRFRQRPIRMRKLLGSVRFLNRNKSRIQETLSMDEE